MNPELEMALRSLGVERDEQASLKAKGEEARKAIAEAQKLVQESEKARLKSNRAEDVLLDAIGRLTKPKKGEDLFYEVDGIVWHVEKENGQLRVGRVKKEK